MSKLKPLYALLALGMFVLAIGVFLMVEGHILGERTTGIATLLEMLGMGIIIFFLSSLLYCYRIVYRGPV